MLEAKNINLYLMDGDSEGRIKCSTKSYPIFVYKIPKTMIDKCKDIKELKQSGIYFLVGSEDDKPFVYVGQAIKRDDNKGVLFRACEPHNSVSYWNEVVIVVSSQDTMGATELNYLENRFCALAKDSRRSNVLNAVTPSIGTFTEEEECDMNGIIENTKMLVGALGYSFLKPYAVNEKDMLYYGNARCQIVSDGFILLTGSEIRSEAVDSCPSYIKKRREDEKLNIENNKLINDIFFTSPSAAAAFVSGYSVSGNKVWKNKEGIPFENL